MSYCRWSDESDVYLIDHCNGTLHCYCGNDGGYSSTSRQDMIDHLKRHREKDGYKVPESVLKVLADDLRDYGDEYPGGDPTLDDGRQDAEG